MGGPRRPRRLRVLKLSSTRVLVALDLGGATLLRALLAYVPTRPAVPPYALTLAWEPTAQAFVASVPELPGCRAQGATYEEAAANAREAIAAWVRAARAQGDPLPAPSGTGA